MRTLIPLAAILLALPPAAQSDPCLDAEDPVLCALNSLGDAHLSRYPGVRTCYVTPYGDRCAPRLSDDEVGRYFVEADRLLSGGDFSSAADTLNVLIAARPEDTFFRGLRGHALVQTGDVAEGMWEFREALRVDSLDAGVYYLRAEAKSGLGDHVGAIDDVLEALDLDDSQTPFYVLGATSAALIGDRTWMLAFSEGGLRASGGACAECHMYLGLAMTDSSSGRTRSEGCRHLSRAGELGQSEAYRHIRDLCQ